MLLRHMPTNNNIVLGGKKMEKQFFVKPEITIVKLPKNDIIVTSPGIELPDEWWDEDEGNT